MICFLIAIQTQQQPAAAATMPKASTLIGTMFKRYADAKTLNGTINMTQSSNGKSYQIQTQIVYQRPDLIRFVQSNAAPGKNPTELVSDGVQFAYTPIPSPLSPPKLLESVHAAGHPALKVGDMYYCVQPTMADRSVPLDVAVARLEDLATIKNEFASFELKGSTAVRQIPVYQIEGQWRDRVGGRISGTFDLFVTPDGECVRFERHTRVGVSPKWLMDHKMPPTAYADGVPVDIVWDVDLKLDQPVSASIFSLRSQ